MKTWICCLALITGITGTGFAQSQPDTGRKVYQFVERMPVFQGDPYKAAAYIAERLHVPDSLAASVASGKIIVKFIVNEAGRIESPSIHRGLHPVLDAEALRIVSGMPAWEPGSQNGKKVPVSMVIPITIRVR